MHYQPGELTNATRYGDWLDSLDDERRAAINTYADSWMAAALTLPMSAEHPDGVFSAYHKRKETVGEVTAEAFELQRGPSMDEVMALLVAASKGEQVQMQAVSLLLRASQAWADMKVDL